MNFLYSFFGKKYSTVFCILLSLSSRTVNVFFSSFTGRDKMRLILQSKNFLQGKGLSVQQFFFDNPEVPLIDNAQLWPPGYPLLIAPFLRLFNYNIYQATTALELFAAIGIIFIIRKICRQLGFPLAAINLMTLIVGCFEYPAISDSQPTDSISLLFFLLSISFSLNIVTKNKITFSQTVFTAFILFLPCFFRYAYPPLSITIPIVIVFYGLVMRNKLLIKRGAWLTGMTMAMILLLFIVLKIETGRATYLTPTERGFFLSNIVHWYPVIPASFIDLPFLTSQCIKYTGITLKLQLQILEIINIALILVISCLFFYSVIVKKIFITLNAFKWLLLWSFACSMMIFLTLGYLSFTYRIQIGYLNVWTYIYEARYYAIVTLFIQLIFIGWISLYHAWKKKLLLRIVVVACSTLLFIETLHSIYFNIKVASDFNHYKSAVFRELDYTYFNEWLVSVKNEYPDYEILATAPGEDSYYMYTASFYGGKGFYDGKKLREALPIVKKKSLLLVMIYDNELPFYNSFISNKNVRFVHRVAYSNFYIVKLFP